MGEFLELKILLRNEIQPRNVRLTPTDLVSVCISNLVNAAKLDASLKWTLFNPDPSVALNQQYLDPTRVIQSYRFRTHHLLELREAPLNIRAFFATRNSNLMSSLTGPVHMALDRHSEFVFNIRRFQQAITQLVPNEEYTFAMIEMHKNNKFRALWINANTSPEMNGLRDNDMLLLWPLSLFEKKSAESLKDPLIAGTVKLTKQENASAAHKRFVLIKFNIMFYYENSKSDKPKGVINLEHYMLSPITVEKKQHVFRFEKVTLSFAPRPKLYTFVFDDAAIAQQWYKVMLFECSNRMVGTKLPPPRLDLPDIKLPPLLKKIPPPLQQPVPFPVEDIARPDIPPGGAQLQRQQASGTSMQASGSVSQPSGAPGSGPPPSRNNAAPGAARTLPGTQARPAQMPPARAGAPGRAATLPSSPAAGAFSPPARRRPPPAAAAAAAGLPPPTATRRPPPAAASAPGSPAGSKQYGALPPEEALDDASSGNALPPPMSSSKPSASDGQYGDVPPALSAQMMASASNQSISSVGNHSTTSNQSNQSLSGAAPSSSHDSHRSDGSDPPVPPEPIEAGGEYAAIPTAALMGTDIMSQLGNTLNKSPSPSGLPPMPGAVNPPPSSPLPPPMNRNDSGTPPRAPGSPAASRRPPPSTSRSGPGRRSNRRMTMAPVRSGSNSFSPMAAPRREGSLDDSSLPRSSNSSIPAFDRSQSSRNFTKGPPPSPGRSRTHVFQNRGAAARRGGRGPSRNDGNGRGPPPALGSRTSSTRSELASPTPNDAPSPQGLPPPLNNSQSTPPPQGLPPPMAASGRSALPPPMRGAPPSSLPPPMASPGDSPNNNTDNNSNNNNSSNSNNNTSDASPPPSNNALPPPMRSPPQMRSPPRRMSNDGRQASARRGAPAPFAQRGPPPAGRRGAPAGLSASQRGPPPTAQRPPALRSSTSSMPPPSPAAPPAAAAAAGADVVTAVYAYNAPNATNDKGERAISFEKGDSISLTERRGDGWGVGKNLRTGVSGLVPMHYTK